MTDHAPPSELETATNNWPRVALKAVIPSEAEVIGRGSYGKVHHIGKRGVRLGRTPRRFAALMDESSGHVLGRGLPLGGRVTEEV